jgi:hypothetical protein
MVVDFEGKPRYKNNVTELYNGKFAEDSETEMSFEGNYYLTTDYCHPYSIDNHCIEYQGDWYENDGNYVVDAVGWGYAHINKVEEIDGNWYHIDSDAHAEMKERLEIEESEESEKLEEQQELLESTESTESTEFKEVIINVPSISGTAFTITLDINEYPF